MIMTLFKANHVGFSQWMLVCIDCHCLICVFGGLFCVALLTWIRPCLDVNCGGAQGRVQPIATCNCNCVNWVNWVNCQVSYLGTCQSTVNWILAKFLSQLSIVNWGTYLSGKCSCLELSKWHLCQNLSLGNCHYFFSWCVPGAVEKMWLYFVGEKVWCQLSILHVSSLQATS